MTLDELRARLDALGIPHDGWSAAGGKTAQLPMFERYKELLLQTQRLLEQQIGQDKVKMAELHAVLQRTQHGGGV